VDLIHFFYSKAAFYIYIPKCIVGFLDYSERRIIGKIQKTFFSGEVIFGGQNPKNAKENFKKILLSQIV